MKIDDLYEPVIATNFLESRRRVWARSGNKIVQKFRCMSGPRKNRVVSKPGQCSKPIDLKKRFAFKKVKARFGKRMAFKRRRTMKRNPYSIRVQKMNKSLRRR